MINLYLFGVIFLRKTTGLISLFLAACLILLWNPTAHTTPAFLLSFGSVFWLMTLGTRLQKTDDSDKHAPSSFRQRCAQITRTASKWIGLPMLSSFLVMLGTMPVSLDFSPHFPIHGPLVNLIAIPLCGFLSVALGLLALALSWICSPLAIGLLYVAEYCTAWLIAWVRFMASFPSAILQLPPLRTNETLALLFALGSLAILPYIPRLSLVLVFFCPLLLLLPPTLSTLQQHLRPTLQVDFLDVGQGDAIFLRFPNQQTMLIDAGGEAFAPIDVGERAILPYLRHQRIHRLDYVVMSHPHPDHFGGFLTLFQQIPIGEFWHNQQRGGHPHYRNLRTILHKQRIPTRSFSRQTTRMIGEVRIDILHPFPGPHEGSTYYWALHANDNSLVMLVTYGKTRLLLTGDIEERAEEILTERYPHLRADLLKVPHHASRTSSTSRLLDHIQPQHAFAGIGRQNLFGFPHAATLKRYKRRRIRLWRTDLHGMIRVHIDKQSFSIHPTLPREHPARIRP